MLRQFLFSHFNWKHVRPDRDTVKDVKSRQNLSHSHFFDMVSLCTKV